MWYSTEYESFKVIEENAEVSFDKFMDDILRREAAESEQKEMTEERKLELLAEAQEAEELRQRRARAYTDRVSSKIVWRR